MPKPSTIDRVKSRHARMLGTRRESRSDLSLSPELLAAIRAGAGGSGVAVNDRTALTFSAFYASVNVISSDVAAMPLRVYRKTGDGGRTTAPEHPLDTLLYTTPDGIRTAMAFRQSLVAHALVKGNGFAEVERDGAGRVVGLHLLPMGSTRAEVANDGRVFYPIPGQSTLPADRVLHLANFGLDGLNGLSAIALFRRGIQVALDAEATTGSAFRNGLNAPGALKIPPGMSDTAVDNLTRSFDERHIGPDGAGRIIIEQDGIEFRPFQVSFEDAQFLQQRQFSVIEMARIFRLPPHKIGDYSQSHLANLEESNRDYTSTALTPWLIRLEQAIALRLFTPQERSAGYYVKHNMNSLLRGNMQARADYFTKMLMAGMSVDEIRALEEFDPIGPDAGGDKHFVPVNLTPLDRAGLAPEAKDAP